MRKDIKIFLFSTALKQRSS